MNKKYDRVFITKLNEPPDEPMIVDRIIPPDELWCGVVSRNELKYHRDKLTPKAIKEAEEFYKGRH